MRHSVKSEDRPIADTEPDAARATPTQRRAHDTRETILEATARVLDAEGAAGLATGRVAERAGFGIGTLYRYFKDRDALVLALAERERAAIRAAVEALAARGDTIERREAIRELARIVIGAFGSRPRVRRAVILHLHKRIDVVAFGRAIEGIAETMREAMRWRPDLPRPSRLRFSILVRAVMGAVRGTVLMEPDKVSTRAFEDEIVALIDAYLSAPAVDP